MKIINALTNTVRLISCRNVSLVAAAALGFASAAHANEIAPSGFTITSGTETSGNYADTATVGGGTHLLYESSVSPKRLEVSYLYPAIGGTGHTLEVTVTQATTGGGQGHDDYYVDFDDGAGWVSLGTIQQNNNPATYSFAFPSGVDFSQGVEVRIVDSIQTDDKKLNHLNIDQLVIAFQDYSPPDGSPSALSAVTLSSSQIGLSWSDNTSNEVGFTVERSQSSGSGFSAVATLAADTTSFTDPNLSPSTTYYYRVQAYNGAGTSAYSNEASDTTDLPPPPPDGSPITDLTATANGDDTVDLAWSSSTTNEEGFRIWRSTSSPVSTGGAPTATVGAGVNSYSDTGLVGETTYYYVVKAYNGGGEQGASNTALAITEAEPGPAGGPATSKVIAGYYESWAIYNARKYYVQDIPFERVTHVNYAFANLSPAGEVVIGDIFADITNTKDPESDNSPGPDQLPQGNIPQLLHMRDVGHKGRGPFPHLKLILSVGGWSWSENFSSAVSTPEGRYRFAESVKQYIAGFPKESDGTVHPLSGELDGVDLDWEYPTGEAGNCGEEGNVCSPDDPKNHALLLLAIRAKLDELGPGKELSMAMPAGDYLIDKVMPPIVDNSYLAGELIMRDPSSGTEWPLGSQTAANALDYLHVMNYDMSGATYSPLSRHHAQLYAYDGPSGDPEAGAPAETQRVNSHFAIQAYNYVHTDYANFDPENPTLDPASGVGYFPMSKLTFGLPMYGKGFKVDTTSAWDGYPLLFQPNAALGGGNNVPGGTWDGGQWGNSGVWGYWDIFTNLGGDQPSYIGNGSGAATRLHGTYVTSSGNIWIGFDDMAMISAKAQYAVDQGMAGVMFWSFPGDISTSTERQGQTNVGDYPSKSLIHNVASELETLAPAP